MLKPKTKQLQHVTQYSGQNSLRRFGHPHCRLHLAARILKTMEQNSSIQHSPQETTLRGKKKAYSSHITYQSKQIASLTGQYYPGFYRTCSSCEIIQQCAFPRSSNNKGLTPTSLVNKPHSSKQQLDGNGT